MTQNGFVIARIDFLYFPTVNNMELLFTHLQNSGKSIRIGRQ